MPARHKAALSRHTAKFAEVKGTSATKGGGLAADGNLILGGNFMTDCVICETCTPTILYCSLFVR